MAPPDPMKLFASSVARIDRALSELNDLRNNLFGANIMPPDTNAGTVMAARAAMLETLVAELKKLGGGA